MNHLAKAFIVYLCVASISCEWFAREANQKATKDIKSANERSLLISKLKSMMKSNETVAAIPVNGAAANETAASRQKRQVPLAWAGGFGLGYGAYDYNDYYGDYANDYNYDYYDWVCSDTSCQLCDILTSECCNPNVDINCFLPDSCLNNPCLGGGTCVTTRTVDLRPDFICVCLPGLTGKYCQLANDYFVGGNIIDPIIMTALAAAAVPPVAPVAPIAPAAPVAPVAPAAGAYGAAPYAQPYAQQYAQPAPAPYAAPQPAPAPYAAPQPAYAQPAYAPQPAYGQQAPVAQPAGYDGAFQQQQPVDQGVAPSTGYGVRTMSAKRPKCAAGQVFSYEKGSCADFSLKRSKVAA